LRVLAVGSAGQVNKISEPTVSDQVCHIKLSHIRLIKSQRIGWAGHVARLTMTNSYRGLAGEPEGKNRPIQRREYNIKIGCEGVEWINLAPVTGASDPLISNTAMNFPSSTKRGKIFDYVRNH